MTTPALPAGFTLDAPASAAAPPLPPGFTLDEPAPRGDPTAIDRAGAVAGGFNAGVGHLAGIPVDAVANVRDLLKIIGGLGYSLVAKKDARLLHANGVQMWDIDEHGNRVPSREPASVDIPEFLEVGDRRNDMGSGAANVEALNRLPGAPASIPRPDDQASRFLHAAGAGASGALIAPATGARVIPSAIAGVTGAEASQLAVESGASPGVAIAAGLAGSMAPSALRVAAAEGTRRALRGSGEDARRRVEENIKTFEDAGTKPTVGQATESRAARATESLLSRTPGSAGRMAAAAEKQGAELGNQVEKVAGTLAPKASGEQAGRAIARGVSGDDGFVAQFKARQEKLYDELDNHIAKDARVDVANTAAALKELNADIPGAPNISEFFKNSKIKGIEGALKADTEGASALKARPDIPEFAGARGAATPKADMDLAAELLNDGKLPYEALKKLRTLVGREMADSSIMSDVPRSKWTALYAALSKDLEGAAKGAGTKATAAYTRANTYTRAGMRRLEVLDGVVDKAGGPEAIFRAATSGAKEGATTLRAVMQSLPQEARKTLSASVLRRMGRATSGRQDDIGERFSTETFLTNWNSMSPQARAVLFDRFGPGFRADMDAIAKVASNLRDGSAVFRNPSGTSQAVAQTSAAVGFITSLGTGNIGTAGGIAAGVAGANVMSRLMTNPNVVKWLAKSTRVPASARPALIAQAARSNDPELRELAQLLDEERVDQ